VSAAHARPPARRRYGRITWSTGARSAPSCDGQGAARRRRARGRRGRRPAAASSSSRRGFVHAFEIDTRFADGLDRLAAGRGDLRLYAGRRLALPACRSGPAADGRGGQPRLQHRHAPADAHHRPGCRACSAGGDAPARARRAALRQAAYQGLLGRVGAGAAVVRARGTAGRAAHRSSRRRRGSIRSSSPSAAAACCRPTRPPCSRRCVRTSFGQRRKQIVNSLSGAAAPSAARRAPPRSRAPRCCARSRAGLPTRPGPKSSRRRSSSPSHGSSGGWRRERRRRAWLAGWRRAWRVCRPYAPSGGGRRGRRAGQDQPRPAGRPVRSDGSTRSSRRCCP